MLSLSLSINNFDSFDLDNVLLEIDKITYLSGDDKIIIKNILNGNDHRNDNDRDNDHDDNHNDICNYHDHNDYKDMMLIMIVIIKMIKGI